MYKKILIILSILIASFLLLKLSNLEWIKSEITEYSVICNNNPINGHCDSVYVIQSPTTYKVSKNRQEVSSLIWGYSNWDKYNSCLIYNRENWSCKFNDNSAIFGFNKGKFWQKDLVIGLTYDWGLKTFYISRSEYFNLRCAKSKVKSLCLFFEMIKF